MSEAPKKAARLVGAVIAFAVGASIAVVAALWRAKASQTEGMPSFIIATAAALGTLGMMSLRIGQALFTGKPVAAAIGVDESRKSSKVTVVFAGLLFVPLWLVSLGMAITSVAPDSSVERLLGWSIASAFLSVLVFGLVREWRR